jgi:hypothetical protein
MDPAARTAYDMPTAWLLHAGAFDLAAIAGLGVAPWSAVEARAQLLGLTPLPGAPALVAAPAPAPSPTPAAPVSAALGRRGGFASGLAPARGPLPSPAPAPTPTPARAVTSPFAARGVPVTNWDAPAALPAYAEIDCCHKGEDDEHVYFEFCRPGDVLHRNYTKRFFEECRLKSQHEEPDGWYFPDPSPAPVDPVMVAFRKAQAAEAAAQAAAGAAADADGAAAGGAAGGEEGKEEAAAEEAAEEGAERSGSGAAANGGGDAAAQAARLAAAGGGGVVVSGPRMPEVLSDPGGPRFNLTYFTARARHPDGTWDWEGIASVRATCPP